MLSVVENNGGTGAATVVSPVTTLNFTGTPVEDSGGEEATVTPPVFFDDSVFGAFSNLNTATPDAAAIDNTKIGIVNLGHDDQSIPSTGVSGNYAVCVGGNMPSIDADYAGGGGYRPNAHGVGAWAFGQSAFADGEGCFAAGKSTVAGRVPSDPNGEAKYATAFGFQTQAPGEGAFAAGRNCLAQGDNSVALGINSTTNLHSLDSIAVGDQCEVKDNLTGGVAMGVSCSVGTGAGDGSAAVAIGNGSHAQGDGSVALGIGCNCTGASSNGSFAAGVSCTTTRQGCIALGQGSQSNALFAVAIGFLCDAEQDASFCMGRAAKSTQYAERAHGCRSPVAGEETGSFHEFGMFGESVNGVTSNLTTGSGGAFILEDDRSFVITVKFMGSRIDAQGNACIYHLVQCHTAGGTLVIDQDTPIVADATLANGQGWTFAISAPGGRELRFSGTGLAGQTVDFAVWANWNVLTGHA
jgi:hypothetical protein